MGALKRGCELCVVCKKCTHGERLKPRSRATGGLGINPLLSILRQAHQSGARRVSGTIVLALLPGLSANSGNWFQGARREQAELHHARLPRAVCGAFQLSRAAQYVTSFRDSQENTPVSSLAPRQLPPSALPLWQPGPALRLSESPKSGTARGILVPPLGCIRSHSPGCRS